jgi:hypothetical protein
MVIKARIDSAWPGIRAFVIDGLFVSGLVMAGIGISLISVPAAVIYGGLVLSGLSYIWSNDESAE